MRCEKCGIITFTHNGLCEQCAEYQIVQALTVLGLIDTNVGFYDAEGFYHPSPEEEGLFHNDMMDPNIFNPEGTDNIEIEFNDDNPF